MEEKYEPVPLDKHWINKQLCNDPELKAEYDARAKEYTLLNDLVRVRTEAGLSQKALAERIGKQQSSIGRLEKTLSKPDGSVSLASLREYASACGKRLEIRFVDM